jgi:peptidoglycan/LPS O-acetylase OafA/YrhL
MSGAETSEATVSSRLAFLDGIRGVAALYVVCFHIWAAVRYQHQGDIPSGLYWLLSWSFLGRSAVCVFIVLSGFCLMLPVVQSADGTLRGGWRGYLKRRATRILPPYFAALLLSLLLAWLMEAWRNDVRVWASFMPSPTLSGTLAHLTLIHNLRLDWIWQANAPLWTIATEWQIYLLFPLVLLPLWKRFGAVVTVGAALLLGLLLDLLLPDLAAASFWFLGLFALGMIAAASLRAPLSDLSLRRLRICGVVYFAVFLALTILCEARGMQTQAYDFPFLWVADVMVGVCAACFLTCSAHRPNCVVHVLELPLCLRLGAMSYSLYLLHFPLIADLAILPARWKWNAVQTILFLYCVGIPLVLVLSWGFSRLVERRQWQTQGA